MNNPSYGLFDAQRRPIAFRGVKVEATLAGLLASTRLVQHYDNATDETLEITYTFPLPVDAVLLGFEVELGERRLVGQVVKRKEAEERYEEAVEAGDSAFRLMKLREGLYSAALGNVLPGESVRIHLAYSEPLKLRAGLLRFRLPTTIAPRYGEAADISAWQRPKSDLAVEYAFEASILLHGALAHASVASATHPIKSCSGGDGLTITTRSEHMDRDFALELRPGEQRSFGAIVHEEDGAYAMVSLLPPPRDAGGDGRDIVILLDCSGSMGGDSIRLAREGVLQSLAQLTPADRFALLRFGSHAESFAQALLGASALNVSRAKDWIRAANADLGGTELAGALRAALGYRRGGDVTRPLDLLLLTDGEVWNLEAVAEEVRQASARIFAIGIGSAPAEEVLRTLADGTGGACDLVTPNEDMPERIGAHFARIRQARITTLEIDWHGTPQWQTRPRTALFAGDAVSLFACLPQGCDTARVRLRYADGTEQEEPIRFDTMTADPARTLARTAAHAMLPYRTASAVEWALRYQLITDETDYIVTAERAADERAQGIPRLQETPHMLAAGWGGAGSVGDLDAIPASVAETSRSMLFSRRRAPALELADFSFTTACMSILPGRVGVAMSTPVEGEAARSLIEQLDAQMGGTGLAGLSPDFLASELAPAYAAGLLALERIIGCDRMQILLAWLTVLVERLAPDAPELPLVRAIRAANARGEIDTALVGRVRAILAAHIDGELA